MDRRIKILHSFPKNEEKFKHVIDLTFSCEIFENKVTHSLIETDLKIMNFDLLVIHYMKIDDIKFLITTEIQIPVIWFAWGGDMYSLGKFQKMLLLPKTNAFFSHSLFQESKFKWLKNIVKTNFSFVHDNFRGKRILKAIDLTDYIIPIVPGDYDLLYKYYKIKPKLFHANYIGRVAIGENISTVVGNNILLGNSATPTNNHIEAIDQLAESNLNGRKVIIPLSYGGNNSLTNAIIKYANNHLGMENTIILRDFLSYDEYSRLVLSCNVLIMNHVRQQALGNIALGLSQGAHVYLREESPIYQYYKMHNIYIGKVNNEINFVGLKDEQIKKNKEIMKRISNPEVRRNKLNIFLQEILQKRSNNNINK